MTILNIYSWKDYAIFRALQGKAIPSHNVWDCTRGFFDRFDSTIYNGKEEFFEKELFTYQSLELTSTKESVFHGTGMCAGRAVQKVDGTLGMSVGIGDFFSGKSTSAADLYFSSAKAEEYGLYNGNDGNIDELIKNITVSISSVDMLFRASIIDQGYFHTPSSGLEESESFKRWGRVNRKLTNSLEGGNRSPEVLLNILGESCGNQFGLITKFVDLIKGKGVDASYLGTPYWFANTFQHSLDERVAEILIDESQSHEISFLTGYKANRKLNSANISSRENIIFEEAISQIPYSNIFQICNGAGWKFEDVQKVVGLLGIKAPYNLIDADRIACHLTGKNSIKSAYQAFRKKELEKENESDSDLPSIFESLEQDKLKLTDEDGFWSESTIAQLTGSSEVKLNDTAQKLDYCAPFTEYEAKRLCYKLTGLTLSMLIKDRVGRQFTLTTKDDSKLKIVSDSRTDNRSGNVIAQQAVAKDYKKTPRFIPSRAIIPYGFPSAGDIRQELSFALNNPEVGIRSFFNDLTILEKGIWSESALYVPAFNESLYCKLVIEYHRYSITDLRNSKQELMKSNEKKGLGIGALLGVMAGGIMAPFGAMMGSNLGKIATNLGNNDTLIEEYLPNPNLLFERDEGSFTHIQDAFKSPTIRRRVCLRRVQKLDGLIYFDVFPMILMESQATPAQIFKWEDAYFMRPISAGLNDPDVAYESKLGYNPVKYRKSYGYHPRFELKPVAELLVTKIIGETVEKEPVVFSAELREDRSFNHCYFDYSKDTQIF